MISTIRTERLLDLQREILEQIVRHAPEHETLTELCRLVERMVDDAICTVLCYDNESELMHLVASTSRAPAKLVVALQDVVPGELAGACAAAALRKQRVINEDTSVDSEWQNLRTLARECGIQSCWAIPLFSSEGQVLGTFGISRTVIGGPSDDELRLLETAGQLGSLAMEIARVDTQFRDQQALLRSIIESSEDPIFAKDHEGRYLLANSADVRGVRPRPEDVIGLTDEDLYPPEVASKNHQTDVEVLSAGVGCQYEQDFDNPIEGRRTFLMRKSPLVGADGRVRGVVGIARDVTQLKRVEEAVRRSQKLESLGVLAGGIAHDFNNLLTGILGNAEMSLESVRAGSVEWDSLQEIRRAAIRAAELTDQMLAYAGQGELQRQVVALPEAVREIVGLLTSSISKSARLRFEFAPGLPNVEIDATQIRQLVMNLVINASEALEGRSGDITLAMREVPRSAIPLARLCVGDELTAERFVALEVTDTGTGMDDETLTRIFDPFFTSKFTGRGLGLAAAQGIVRSHGGGIEVTSATGAGTTFVVYLPATEAEAATVTPAVRDAWTGRGCVLVVEDESLVSGIVSVILERAGIDVSLAADGAQAVALTEQFPTRFDAVLLDRTTPGLSGIETCQRLRAIRPDLKVILSSGYSERVARQEFEGVELSGFLKKPYGPDELLEVVRDALRDEAG